MAAAGTPCGILTARHDSREWERLQHELSAWLGKLPEPLIAEVVRAVGHSIHDDILRVKLAEVRRLVTTTELPLKAISPRAGFRSVSSMTTMFSRHLGSTPAALRKLESRPGASRKDR